MRLAGVLTAAAVVAAGVFAPLALESASAAQGDQPQPRTAADIESGPPVPAPRGEHPRPLGVTWAAARQATGREWSLTARLSPAKQAANRALRRSQLAAGRHPNGRQPNEPYMPQVACYAGELPGVAQFRDMLLATFPRTQESLGTYNITRGCNVPGISEHEEGRALDWEARVGNRQQDTQARQLLRWLTRNNGYQAKRFGIMYMIYDQHIWGQYNQRWRWMSDRGGITDNHKDHVHFTFTWNGALQRAAYWSGQARRVHRGPCARYRGHYASLNVQRLATRARAGACPEARPIPRTWQFGPSVMYWQQDSRAFWLQQFLSEEGFYDGEVNGVFGSLTYDAVRRFQVDHGVGMTGVWDPATQNASHRVVDKRHRSAVSWDAVDMTAAAGQQVPVTATITAPETAVSRSIRVEHRPVGGEWATVIEGVTNPQGQWQTTLPAAAVPGVTEYRVVLTRTSYATSAATRLRTITVAPAPLPSVTSSSAPSLAPSPSPGASESG